MRFAQGCRRGLELFGYTERIELLATASGPSWVIVTATLLSRDPWNVWVPEFTVKLPAEPVTVPVVVAPSLQFDLRRGEVPHLCRGVGIGEGRDRPGVCLPHLNGLVDSDRHQAAGDRRRR